MRAEHKFFFVGKGASNSIESGSFEFFDGDVIFGDTEYLDASDFAKKTLGLSHYKGKHFPAFLDAVRKFCIDFDIVLVEGEIFSNGNYDTFRTALDRHEAGRLLLKHGVSDGRQGKAL